MGRLGARFPSLLVFALAVAACPFGPSDDEPDPGSPEALIGVWQYTTPGDVESTLEFLAGGTFRVVDAYVSTERCSSEGGTWTASDGVLLTTATVRPGRASMPCGAARTTPGRLTA